MREGGETVPKPLVEIGGRPILWHVMSIYAAQGFRRFVLLSGHGGRADRGVRRRRCPSGTSTCLDTGLDTPTGGRVAARRASCSRAARFCLTYADGVADIDLRRAARLPPRAAAARRR